MLGLEAFHLFPRQCFADQAFDAVQVIRLVGADQRIGLSGRAGAPGTADAMYIILRDVRQVEVDHLWQLLNIQTPCRNVRSHQSLYPPLLEIAEGSGARVLALVTVNGNRPDTVLLKLLAQFVGAVLGTRKHQHLVPAVGMHQVAQQLGLALLVHWIHPLLHCFGRGIRRADLYLDRALHVALCQLRNLGGKRGGEHQRLALYGQQFDDTADIVNKAHVQHAVSLIEHQHFQVAEIHESLPMEVEQTPWRGDQHVDTALQLRDLRVDVHAAKHDSGTIAIVLAVVAHAFLHLSRQFAGRRQHQGATAVGLHTRASCEALQQWQGERRGFTGTGLCGGHDIPACKDQRNGFRLDG